MIVKIYLEKGAKMPTKAHDTDYGWDVCATTKEVKSQRITYGTGIHLAPQTDGKNVCIQAFPRSSIVNTGLILSNGVGIVDSGYRGEIMLNSTKWSAARPTTSATASYRLRSPTARKSYGSRCRRLKNSARPTVATAATARQADRTKPLNDTEK